VNTYTVALGNTPHSLLLKNGTVQVKEAHLEFPDIKPIFSAFAPMVRELKYDISEMAIATYLQAREAGKPITLLPVVLNGDFHHHSITRWPGSKEIGPRDLIGQRVGVRAYSQTTGLWVRGVLKEEFGVEAGQITWVTTEGAHVSEYVEPSFVERTDSTLADLLRDGDIAAAVLGPNALDDEGGSLIPVIPDVAKAEEAWFERHHAVPINHMLTVKTELLESDPAAVKGIYCAFTEAIDQVRAGGVKTSRQRAITYGRNDALVSALEAAVRYGQEQDMLRSPVTVDELFADFQRYVAK
jgi:4,5-dihydroxyphthalate decarboxylase